MSDTTGHDSRRDEIAAYLLGSLEPGESAELERHLAGCEACRNELDWLRPAVQLLPEAVPRLQPPAELRERILAEAGEVSPADVATVTLPRRRRFGLRPAIALAAVALVVAIGVGFAISSGGGSSTVVAGRSPHVTAAVERKGDSGILRLANLHEPPRGKVFEAWVRRGTKVMPANALFVPNPDGTATAVIGDMRDVNTVMVTAEPRGGSATPSGTPVVSVTLPQ